MHAASVPHKEGTGFAIELRAVGAVATPILIDGSLVVLPPDAEEDNRK